MGLGGLFGGDETLTLQIAVSGLGTFNATMSRVDSRVDKSARRWDSVGSSIKNVAVVAIAQLLARAIEGAIRLMGRLIGKMRDFIALSVGEAVDFDLAIRKLAIAANDTGLEYDQLSAVTLALGKDTRLLGVDALGAADGLEKLFLAGLDAEVIFGPGGFEGVLEDSEAQLGAFKLAAQLAAVSALELEESSELAVAALATFGQGTTGAEQVDFLTDAFNDMVAVADLSTAEIHDFRAALKNTGPTAAALGFDFNETAVALGVLADNGIRGAEAGTALRRMIANLNRDTKKVREASEELGVSLFDNEGKTRALRDIFFDYSNALREGTFKETIRVRDATHQQTQAFRDAQEVLGKMNEAIGKHQSGIKILSDTTLEKYILQQSNANREIAAYNELGFVAKEVTRGYTEEEKANLIQTLAGVRGQNAFNALLTETNEELELGQDKWAKYVQVLEEGGEETQTVLTLQQRMDAIMKSVSAQLEILNDLWKTFRIQFGTAFLTGLTAVVSALQTLFNTLEDNGTLDNFLVWVEGVATQLGGFLAGVIANIPMWLETAVEWWGKLTTAFETGSNFVENTLIPVFDKIRGWLEQIAPLFTDVAETRLQGQFLPVIEALWQQIQENVIPALEQFIPFIDEFLPQAIEHVTEIWETFLKPALLLLTQILIEFVIPVLGQFIKLLITSLVTALTVVANVYFTVFAPLLEEFAASLRDDLLPLIAQLAEWLREKALPAIMEVVDGAIEFQDEMREVSRRLQVWIDLVQLLWEALKERLLKELQNVASFLQDVFHDAVTSATLIVEAFKLIIDALKGAMDRVKSAIKGVIDKVNAFKDAIANVKLPDWMTPGSPPPLFFALQDIKNAMDEISRVSAPNLAASFGAIPAPAGLGGGSGSSTSTTDARQFNLTTQTTLGPGELALEFRGLELASR